ncbi:ABC transporter permease [Nocardioides panaciterrulae]|uniref:Transport permease protein n=1 Tax=Nocardioides panaciterrulae TaxID=661492 RepID=A0A7Y9E4Q4_9ACTN|nr:ABC transporter permease [Nocardioides panaciterrulae]NYD40937.1 ABC-2 type transport system permease protein [Nocardioides panaciterrulae]
MSQTARAVHVVDEPLAPPSANQGLFEVFRRRYLLKLLVRREIAARYQGSFLGLLWSYINPLSQFFIYWFVIGYIMGTHKNVENFPVHIFAGLIVVHFFTETFNAGTRSIVRNKSLVKKMALPRETFPVASMLVSLYHVGPQLLILVIACLCFGWTPDPMGMVAALLAVLVIMLLGTGMALLFAAANVFFRDFSSAVNILTNFVRFGVPMIYPYTKITTNFPQYVDVYLSNPIADAVLLMQRAFWVGTTENPAQTARVDLPSNLFGLGLYAVGVSVVILLFGQLIFSRLQNRIPERLQ